MRYLPGVAWRRSKPDVCRSGRRLWHDGPGAGGGDDRVRTIGCGARLMPCARCAAYAKNYSTGGKKKKKKKNTDARARRISTVTYSAYACVCVCTYVYVCARTQARLSRSVRSKLECSIVGHCSSTAAAAAAATCFGTATATTGRRRGTGCSRVQTRRVDQSGRAHSSPSPPLRANLRRSPD